MFDFEQENGSNHNLRPDGGSNETRREPTKKKKVADVCRHFGRS